MLLKISKQKNSIFGFSLFNTVHNTCTITITIHTLWCLQFYSQAFNNMQHNLQATSYHILKQFSQGQFFSTTQIVSIKSEMSHQFWKKGKIVSL